MKEDWTKDIQRLIADHKGKAPDGLLDDIKAEMNRRGLSCPQPSEVKGARIVPLWRKRWVQSAAAAAAIALFVAVPMIWKSASEEVVVVADKKGGVTSSNVQKTPISSSENDENGASDEESATGLMTLNRKEDAAKVGSQSLYAFTTEPSNFNVNAGVPQSETEAGVKAVEQASKGDKPNTETTEKTAQKPVDKNKGYIRNNPSRKYDEPSRQYEEVDWHHNDGSGFMLTAYYGGGATSTGHGETAPVAMSDAPIYGMYPADMIISNNKYAYGVSSVDRKAHHKQPIKAGISVGYRLNDKWSMQTGVTYSYLSTDFTSEGMSTRTQKLHYVGVPLTASYSVLRGRKAEVYVTAGGEVEKLVKGSVGSENYESEKVKEGRPQFSVKAAVGGAYNFTPNVSVYVEPGVNYYFDNHSSVINSYKDHPTSFSLNMGFRININK